VSKILRPRQAAHFIAAIASEQLPSVRLQRGTRPRHATALQHIRIYWQHLHGKLQISYQWHTIRGVRNYFG